MSHNEIVASIVRETEVDSTLEQTNKNLTNFGIAFLDDALVGIMPNDLCLIGSRSGIGKTQLATSIASFNASAGKKNVVFIALEAEKNEIEMRLRYTIEAGLYFKDQNRDRSIVMTYRNWRLGFLQNALKRYRDEAINAFTHRFARLHTVYRDENYSMIDLRYSLDQAKEFGDLFILDHLHFIDLLGGQNENSEISQIVKQIRSLNLFYSKPFIAISHLRKNIDNVVPGLEDYHGSSDIGKVATVAIMLAKDPAGYDAKNQIQKTIFSIPKARTGSLGNLVGQLDYSIKHQMYVPRYSLAKVYRNRDKEVIEKLPADQIPDWAKNAEKQAEAPK